LSLDTSSIPLKDPSEGQATHRVFALPENGEPLIYFKANGFPSIEPQKEFMLYSLYRQLQIPVPETALLIFSDVFDENPNSFYAVQASEAVLGESFLKAYKDPKIIFNNETFVQQAIGAFLTNPSDGSPQNFKYSPKYQTLIRVENNSVFQSEPSLDDINVKSILYLLPQMDNIKSIPESVQIYFTTLDPELTTLAWLKDLSIKNEAYKVLFARLSFQNTRCFYQNLHFQSNVPSLEECVKKAIEVDGDNSFLPQILVSAALTDSITEKLQKIEKTLMNNRSASPQIVFENISPILAKYYQKLRLEFNNDPETAINALSGGSSCLTSLADNEELKSLPNPQPDENLKRQSPEKLFQINKQKLSFPLDSFIKRQSVRIMKKSLNLQEALNELRLIIKENLTDSRSIRDIADFLYQISNQTDLLAKEIRDLLSDLPHPELKWLLTLEKYFLR